MAAISLFAAAALQRSINEDSMSHILAARQWKYTLDQGKPNPILVIFASTLFAICAWSAETQATSAASWPYFATASAVTFATIPYTFVWIIPINKRITELASQLPGQKTPVQMNDQEEEEVPRLISSWASLNWIRSMIVLTASCIALASNM